MPRSRGDDRYSVYGTWAQGLYLGAMTLAFLEQPQITRVYPFSMASNDGYSALFTNQNGFDNFDKSGFTSPPSPTKLTGRTTAWSKTACGNVIALIGKAIWDATQAHNLTFNNHDLYGWEFAGGEQHQMVILNLGPNICAVNSNYIFNILASDYDSESLYSGINPNTHNYDPFGYVIGNDQENFYNTNSNQYDDYSTTMSYSSPHNGMCVLQPYSITRIFSVSNVNIVPAAETLKVCSNGTINMRATGAATYQWSPGDGLSSITESNVVFTPAGTGTYTVMVTGYDGNGSIVGTQTKTIVAEDIGSITATPLSSSTYCGAPIQLSASPISTPALYSGASEEYWWAPTLGLYDGATTDASSAIQGTSVYAVPLQSTTYSLIGIVKLASGITCYRESINNPAVEVTSVRLKDENTGMLAESPFYRLCLPAGTSPKFTTRRRVQL